MDPFTRDEVAHIVTTARSQFPDWYPWLLCGLRTGMRAGELIALHWSDFNWRLGFVLVQRNLVRGQVTTPKNHCRRKVDLSRQLMVTLRLWRRQQRALWLKKGLPFPDWVFASVTGTALDESNVRKALNRILDVAGLHRRGPHQMRHTFASQLLAGRRADHLRQSAVGTQGCGDHAARVRALVARRVDAPTRRRAGRHGVRRHPGGTTGRPRRGSHSAKCFGISGEPNLHELEPDRRLAEKARSTSPGRLRRHRLLPRVPWSRILTAQNGELRFVLRSRSSACLRLPEAGRSTSSAFA